MLLASQEKSASRKRSRLSGWERFTRKPSPKPAFDPDNMEHWMKRVEKASKLAVSEVPSVGRRLWDQIIDLEASEQTGDPDETCAEAQKLVSDWLDTKLKQELASDGEGDAGNTVSSVAAVPEVCGLSKYNKFDDLCGYLEEEEESTTVQKFIDHLLHKDVLDSGMLEGLGMKENQDRKQQKDPCLTMEMRHKQVKENRLRREKELECQRIEKALRKAAFLEAQRLVQEEKKRKALEAKKEEEEIQREMVKLRREIIERRRTVEEVWKTEKKKQEESSQRTPEKDMCESAPIPLDEEKIAKERKRKLKELLIQVSKENHQTVSSHLVWAPSFNRRLPEEHSADTLIKTQVQCQKRYFSAWHKLILDHRIELGKAGTLSDWKLQLKVLRAWRDYTRFQQLERETQAMENDLREENRKQQLATAHNRKQVLRHCFAEWYHWHHGEIGRRELAVTKEETRRKMDELLKAASLGKLCARGSSGPSTLLKDPSMRHGEVTAVPPLWEKPPLESTGCMPRPPLGRPAKNTSQASLQNVPLNTPDKKQPRTVDAAPSQEPSSNEKLRTTSQKAEPICMGHFHNRHIVQQQLIERQKKKLQEQQKIILELKENQRLAEARWATERAAAGTDGQSRLLSNPREEEEPKRACQMLLNSPAAFPGTEASRSDSQNSLSGPRRNPRQPLAPHPILKAMEERASQRAERRRILAERKKKQEEEKLAQLKAQEEERQKREADEKEAQLERKREEQRLRKMKELERQKRIERNQQLEAIAKEHYERVVLRKKGLEPWKRLRMQIKQNMQVAKEHHSLATQRKCLLKWFRCCQHSMAGKAAQADQLYSQILQRRAIRSWLQYLIDLEEEVRKLYGHFLRKKVFRAWLNTVREAKTESQSKYETAAEQSDRRIFRTTFQTWKQSARLMKEERLKEERRAQLRRKVAEILPDFQMPAPP